MGYLIPDDWDGESWAMLTMCVPDSEDWRSSYTGAISYLNRGWQWDEATGSVNDTIQTAREAFMTLQICGFGDIIAALDRIVTAIQAGNNCCGETFGDTPDIPGTIDGTEGVPPPGFVAITDPVNTHKCNAANLFYHGVENVLTELIAVNFESQFALGMTVITTVFAAVMTAAGGIFAAFVDYIGFVAQLIFALWTGEFSLEDALTEWQANKSEIICLLYQSGDVETKKIAYDELVDTFTLTTAEKTFLKAFATVSTVASTYYTPEQLEANWDDLLGGIDSTYFDCAGCAGSSGWEMAPNQGEAQGDIDDMSTAWVEVVGINPGNGNNQALLRRVGFTLGAGVPCPETPTVGGPLWVAASIQTFKNWRVCADGTTASYDYPTGLPAQYTDDVYQIRVTMNGNVGASFWFTTNETVSQTPPPGTSLQ